MVEHDRGNVVGRGRPHPDVSEHTGGLWETAVGQAEGL
jgi:hypothetical protein